jgi:hypothetical protein
VIRRIGHPLALLALFVVAGGHWAVLQSVAWVGMAVEYSQHAGMAHGLAETFDGDHPCPLCAKVEQGRQQEEKAPALVKVEKKAEASLAAPLAVSLPASTDRRWSLAASATAPTRADAPSVPPPRA